MEKLPELGEWHVDVNEDLVPDMVELKLSEIGEDGINQFVAYFPVETARDIARAVDLQADWIEKYR